MTSIDQAFVKAYARRNQSARTPPEAEATAGDDGSLQLNPSAAASARVWVDAADAGRQRYDSPETNRPKPHLETSSGDVHRLATAADTDPSSAPPAASPTARRPAEPGPAEPGPAEMGIMESAPRSTESDGAFYAHATLAPELANLYAEPPTPAAPAPLRFDPPAGDRPPQPAAPEPPPTAPAPAAPAPQSAIAAAPAAESPTPESSADAPPAHAPAAPVPPASPAPFQPVWEVDHFELPESVARLFLNSSLFEQIGEKIAAAAGDGLRSILVTSTRSGEGRSTAAIGTAMAAASSGLAVALVDADARRPTLADDLRLDLEYGWLDALRGDLPLEEISVYSIEDRLTLLPLMPPPGNTAATAAEVDALVQKLRSHFGLVVLDGSPADGASPTAASAAVDTALIVRDVTRTSAVEVQRAAAGLRASGVQGIGVIENFS